MVKLKTLYTWKTLFTCWSVLSSDNVCFSSSAYLDPIYNFTWIAIVDSRGTIRIAFTTQRLGGMVRLDNLPLKKSLAQLGLCSVLIGACSMFLVVFLKIVFLCSLRLNPVSSTFWVQPVSWSNRFNWLVQLVSSTGGNYRWVQPISSTGEFNWLVQLVSSTSEFDWWVRLVSIPV